jgi:hypothetical protein
MQLIQSSYSFWKVKTTIILILLMRKLKPMQAEEATRKHLARDDGCGTQIQAVYTLYCASIWLQTQAMA